MELAVAALGSSLIGVMVAYWLNRHKTKAEVTRLHVDTALLLEERVYARYTSISDSLANAEKALASATVELEKAREELVIQDRYIQELTQILKAAGIEFPSQAEFM